jgi:hypothetical protein
LLQSYDNAKRAVLPEGANLATLFHETLHDVYARKLTTEQMDLFIQTACQEVSWAFTKKRFFNPERPLFRQVASHAEIETDEIITPQQLAELKRTNPDRPLVDLLDKGNARFFCELFPMAAEIAFGYEIFLGGAVPDALLSYYNQIYLRHPSVIGRWFP